MPFFLLLTLPPPPAAHWGIQYSLRTASGHTSGWQRWSTNHQRLLPKQALALIATLSFHLLSLETLKSFLTPLSFSPHIQSHSKSCQFCLQPMNKMSCIQIKIVFIKWYHQPLKKSRHKDLESFSSLSLPLSSFLLSQKCCLLTLPAVLYCRLLLGADASSRPDSLSSWQARARSLPSGRDQNCSNLQGPPTVYRRKFKGFHLLVWISDAVNISLSKWILCREYGTLHHVPAFHTVHGLISFSFYNLGFYSSTLDFLMESQTSHISADTFSLHAFQCDGPSARNSSFSFSSPQAQAPCLQRSVSSTAKAKFPSSGIPRARLP